jgi:hypothetical protein
MKMENYKGSTGFCVGQSVTCKLFALEGGEKGRIRRWIGRWYWKEQELPFFFLSSYL